MTCLLLLLHIDSMKTAYINIKVIPKSSRNEIIGWENNELKIRLKAVPEKGEANEKLVKFLAKTWGIPQSQIELVAGQKSRHKRLKIEVVSDDQFPEILTRNDC